MAECSTLFLMQDIFLEQRISILEKKVRRFRRICLFQIALLTVVGIFATTRSIEARADSSILRTQGLIIEDAQGRARVILGSPFPVLKERKRHDEPTEAMVFLDEQGHDRLILGEAPDPNLNGKIAKRIAPSFGIVIHDTKGNERGGFVYLANGRVSLGLDRPEQDGWGAMIDDKTGFAGTVTFYAPDIAGRNVTGLYMGTKGNEASIHVKDIKDVDRAVLQLKGDASPTFQMFDKAGQPGGNLLSADRDK